MFPASLCTSKLPGAMQGRNDVHLYDAGGISVSLQQNSQLFPFQFCLRKRPVQLRIPCCQIRYMCAQPLRKKRGGDALHRRMAQPKLRELNVRKGGAGGDIVRLAPQTSRMSELSSLDDSCLLSFRPVTKTSRINSRRGKAVVGKKEQVKNGT